MNGVWRVMGVLATSRALGDYPLKVPNWTTYSGLNICHFPMRPVHLSSSINWILFAGEEGCGEWSGHPLIQHFWSQDAVCHPRLGRSLGHTHQWGRCHCYWQQVSIRELISWSLIICLLQTEKWLSPGSWGAGKRGLLSRITGQHNSAGHWL